MSNWDHFYDWRYAHKVSERVASGADVNARLTELHSRPLHEAASFDDSAASVQVLVEAGANVEASDVLGRTPLWIAVRSGNRNAVDRLLMAGADPWRVVVSNRSAGQMGILSSLADLFRELPGASDFHDERSNQQSADDLIEWYDDAHGPDGFAIAFVSNVAATTLAERMESALVRRQSGGSSTPEIDLGDHLWIREVPGGCLATQIGTVPASHLFLATASRDTISVGIFDNPIGGVSVRVAEGGVCKKIGDPSHDPGSSDPKEAWAFRFGDGGHQSSYLSRCLALATELSGVRPESSSDIYSASDYFLQKERASQG